MTDRDRAFVQSAWDRSQKYSATALRDMTHRESPWVDARGGLPADAASDAEISPAGWRTVFLPRMVEGLKRQDSRIDPAAWRASADASPPGGSRPRRTFVLRYAIVVPEPVRDEISSWALPRDAEDELYARLDEELADDPFAKGYQVPAPSPTLVYAISLQDPFAIDTVHHWVVAQCA